MILTINILRKNFLIFSRDFSDFCKLIVDNPYWENLSLLIIISNSIIILVSDPKDPNNLILMN